MSDDMLYMAKLIISVLAHENNISTICVLTCLIFVSPWGLHKVLKRDLINDRWHTDELNTIPIKWNKILNVNNWLHIYKFIKKHFMNSFWSSISCITNTNNDLSNFRNDAYKSNTLKKIHYKNLGAQKLLFYNL